MRHSQPKQRHRHLVSRGGGGVRASSFGIVTVFLTRRTFFSGGAALGEEEEEEEEEEEDARSRPDGDAMESCAGRSDNQREQVAATVRKMKGAEEFGCCFLFTNN